MATERRVMSIMWEGMASSRTKWPDNMATMVAVALVQAMMMMERPSLSPRPCSSTPNTLMHRPASVAATRIGLGATVAARTMKEEAANMQPAVPPKKNSPALSSTWCSLGWSWKVEDGVVGEEGGGWGEGRCST